MKNKNNPWINTALKVWQETLKKHGIKNGAKMLRWCAYDTEFIPNRSDGRFRDWVKKGITHYNTLVHMGVLRSFESVQKKHGLEKSDFYRFLQLRHYMNQTLSDAFSLETSDFMMVFITAGDSPTCSGIISRLYNGLQQHMTEDTYYVKDKWQTEGNFTMTIEEWEKTCEVLWESTCSNMWREFNWKNQIRYFITPLQKRYRDTGVECWRSCKQNTANHFHVFWGCSVLVEYWKEIHKHLEEVFGILIPFRFDTLPYDQ